MQNKVLVYNPIEFIQKIELFTLTMIGSFASWRLLNVIYDNIYEPIIDGIVDKGDHDKYYTQIGNYYIPIGIVVKEFIKWIIIIIFLMMLYNSIGYFY